MKLLKAAKHLSITDRKNRPTQMRKLERRIFRQIPKGMPRELKRQLQVLSVERPR
jgi:hypothetical protein